MFQVSASMPQTLKSAFPDMKAHVFLQFMRRLPAIPLAKENFLIFCFNQMVVPLHRPRLMAVCSLCWFDRETQQRE